MAHTASTLLFNVILVSIEEIMRKASLLKKIVPISPLGSNYSCIIKTEVVSSLGTREYDHDFQIFYLESYFKILKSKQQTEQIPL